MQVKKILPPSRVLSLDGNHSSLRPQQEWPLALVDGFRAEWD